MDKLQTQLHRLYGLEVSASPDMMRAMALELSAPADWSALSGAWQGVQVDLALPAPAIAVTGLDGYQLWFSLAAPVPADQALAFLAALRSRYLPGIAPQRIRLITKLDARLPQPVRPDQWSAFVAPDLAPMFAETPWLDMPPNPDGQAALLSQLDSIKPDAFQAALRLLTPTDNSTQAHEPERANRDPKGFLLDVMNDDAVALSLRIEAAKALLPYFASPR